MGGEGGRSFRPEIRGMPGLKKKKTFLAPSGLRARLHGEFHPGRKFRPASETNPLKTKLSITWRGIQPVAQFNPG